MPFGAVPGVVSWRGSVFPEVLWRSRRTFATGPAPPLAAHLASTTLRSRQVDRRASLHHTYRRSPSSAAMPAWWACGISTIGGWTAGPHLYLAPDGIWRLTPLNLGGVRIFGCVQPHPLELRWLAITTPGPGRPRWPRWCIDTLAALFGWRGLRTRHVP